MDMGMGTYFFHGVMLNVTLAVVGLSILTSLRSGLRGMEEEYSPNKLILLQPIYEATA